MACAGVDDHAEHMRAEMRNVMLMRLLTCATARI